MSDRFFVSDPISKGPITLSGPEAHHLIHVMRAHVGDPAILFDGSGSEFDAKIVQVDRSSVCLEVHSQRAMNRESAVELVLAVAFPKPDRQRWLIEKAVELGVARIVPITTSRSGVRLNAASQKKLERIVIEASKQCGRNTLMGILDPVPIEAFLASPAKGAQRWLAHPPSDPGMFASHDLFERRGNGSLVHLAIGPEGGFSEEEVALAIRHQWCLANLGPRILRIETAAIAMASIILVGT